jgi:hypothetical protein
MAALARSLRVPFMVAPLAAVTVPTSAAASIAAKVGLSRLALLGWGAGSTIVVSGVVAGIALHEPAAPSAPMPAAVVTPVQNQAAPRVEAVLPAPEVAAPLPSVERRLLKDAPATWDEPQLIERARKALSTDPRRALALTQEHQRRFPAGALGVERDVIALEALARSGQTAEARRRALVFEAKYPKSIHLPRVRALLARLGS